jgi:hypothetical protein
VTFYNHTLDSVSLTFHELCSPKYIIRVFGAKFPVSMAIANKICAMRTAELLDRREHILENR